MNNPTLPECCFRAIGRADIEESKSHVASVAWRPQASYPCGNFSVTSACARPHGKGSIDRAFAAPRGTGAEGPAGLCSFAPRRVSVPPEPAFGRLRCPLAGAPPQPNSPSGGVPRGPLSTARPPRGEKSSEWRQGLAPARRSPVGLYRHRRSTAPDWSQAQQGLLAPLGATRPFPSLWFREDAPRDSENLVRPFMHVQNCWTRHLATLKES